MNEFPFLVTLAVVVALAGRLWARLLLPWARLAGWLSLAAATAVTTHASADWPAFARMVSLCVVLLAAMKALVYVEWTAGKRSLAWSRYCAFTFLWFGMDPGAFAGRRSGLEWRQHLRVGLTCLLVGLVAALLVRAGGWTAILILFVPLSVAFHFGALRILTAAWRGCGYPVRKLFRNPLASTGLSDFWSARWNLGYSQMMARVVLRPTQRLLGWRAASFLVFAVSGVLHEVAITVPVQAGIGGPTAYFCLQGLAVHGERFLAPGVLRRAWAALWVAGPLGILFPPAFRDEVIVPCLQILPDLNQYLP